MALWESYRALSKGTIEIPLDGIFSFRTVSTFADEDVSAEMQGGKLIVQHKQTQITNDIGDGESLLDDGLFADKHILLLCNIFLFNFCGS